MADIIRVRFAPSPTGHLHIGGARTALFNFLYAKRQGGIFVLRLEDTDTERSTEESVQMILQDMKWLGLTWDEGPGIGGPYGPYRQTERLGLYQTYTETLLANGGAYYCFCSSETLETKREKALAAGAPVKYDGTCRGLSQTEAKARIAAGEPHVVRLKIPAEGKTVFQDIVRGEVSFENTDLDDFVLVRSNGFPTYNFAAVIDDVTMKITHVIRGDDHISNTPRQICVYRALGAALPKFAHVPMILGPDKTRLSKRHGATSVGAYGEEGFLPETMLNYLALLGWSFDDKTTLFTLKELEEKFSLKRVSKNPAIFDSAKIQWMNGMYIRKLPEVDYKARGVQALVKANLISPTADEKTLEWAGRVAWSVRNNIKVFSEIPNYVGFFFGEEIAWDESALEKLGEAKPHAELFKTLHAKLSMIESFSTPALELLFKDLIEKTGVKFGVVVHPLRVAITGSINSPQILDVMELLGKERVVKRLAAGLKAVGIHV